MFVGGDLQWTSHIGPLGWVTDKKQGPMSVQYRVCSPFGDWPVTTHGVCSCLVPCLHPSYSSVNADLGWVQKSPSDIIHKPCMYAFRRPSNTVCVVLSEIDQLQHTGSAHAWSLVPSIVFDCERRSRLSPKIPRDVVYKPCLYAFRRPSDTVCVVPSEIDQLQHTGLYCLMLLAPLNAHDRPGTSSFWSGFTMSFLWRQFFHMSLLDGTA